MAHEIKLWQLFNLEAILERLMIWMLFDIKIIGKNIENFLYFSVNKYKPYLPQTLSNRAAQDIVFYLQHLKESTIQSQAHN